MNITLHTDGGARGNPGPAGIGGVLEWIGKDHKKHILPFSEFIGHATNNQAEYRALLLGLSKAQEVGATEVDAYLDSELVAKQCSREYKIKNADLQTLFLKVWNHIVTFKAVRFHTIPREKNREADRLVNEAIDHGGAL